MICHELAAAAQMPAFKLQPLLVPPSLQSHTSGLCTAMTDLRSFSVWSCSTGTRAYTLLRTWNIAQCGHFMLLHSLIQLLFMPVAAVAPAGVGGMSNCESE